MKRAHWLLLGALAGCRTRTPAIAEAGVIETKPLAVDAGAADAGAADAAPAARPEVGTIATILFSPKGSLAFLFDGSDNPSAFRVVDLRTGHDRVYAGAPPRATFLGFDNRCDVSTQGYMPNVSIAFADTDITENFFVRHLGANVNGQDIREDFARGVPAPAPETVTLKGDNIVVDTGAGHVTIAFPGTGSTVDHLDLATGLFVVSRADEGETTKRCLFDLHAPAAAPLCAVYQQVTPFSHQLASDDGKLFAWNSAFAGKSTHPKNDEYSRDSSADECFLYIANLGVGKIFKTKSKCALTGERPLRFVGDELITDDSDVHRCSAVITRRYDTKTGALKDQTKGPRFPDDIDKKLADVIYAKEPDEGDIRRKKLTYWPTTFGLDSLVAWSEGDSVLARKGSDLLLCKKRGGTCRPSLMKVDDDVVTGSDKEGKVFGVVSNGHFVAFDALTGAKKLDIPLEGQ